MTDKIKHTIFCALHKAELTHCSFYNTNDVHLYVLKYTHSITYTGIYSEL